MKHKIILYLIVFLYFSPIRLLQAQFFITGDPPGKARWMTLQSDYYKFIFPREMEQQAREFAVSFDQSWERVTSQLSHRPKPIPVVFHPWLANSNGLVSWAPRRMEIYPTSPQDVDPLLWIHQLALHETRHVAQISKLNQGFTRIFSIFTGEISTGLAAGMIPAWFYEGDAVYAETAFSTAGRGRNPSFEMKIKAQVNEDPEIFSYDKSLFGSYRDFVPNHYEYGYQMVAFASDKYGHDFWSNVLDFTGKYPFVPFAFRTGMKHKEGITPSLLYQQAMGNLKEMENFSEESQADNRPKTISPPKKDYINYYSPRFLSDNQIAVLKDGPGYVRQIVTLDDSGKERKLYIPGVLSANKISATANKITWSEIIPGARWGNQSYSVIKVLNIDTGKETQLTRNTRYYAPAFSPDGKYIAAVENDILNNCYLILLDTGSGILLKKITAPAGSFIQFPEWLSEDEIVMTLLDNNGKHLVSYNKTTDDWNRILSAGNYDISSPSGNTELILFNSNWENKDNVFVLERNSGKLYRFTNSLYGSFGGVFNETTREIAYSSYSNKGFYAEKITKDYLFQTSYTPPLKSATTSFSTIEKDPVDFLPDNEKALGYKTRNYSKLGNLFHFHSWVPFYFDFENLNPTGEQEIYPGITFLSQNLLNTAVSQLSYAYKNGRHFTSNSFTYRGFVPVIELGMDYGDEPRVYMGRDTVGLAELQNDLMNIKARVYIPLQLTFNRYVRGLVPSFQINYNNSYYHYTVPDEYKRGRITLDWRLNYYSYLRMSPRDISPRWGSQFRMSYYTSPFESENFGTIFNATAIGYLPGMFKHHSIRLRGDYQKQKPVKYFYRSLVEFPRGFTSVRTETLHSLKSDYFFPILYPDLSIPGIVYLKRIRGSFYYDLAINQFRVLSEDRTYLIWRKANYFSTGFELLADYHVLRLLFPFTTGLRVNYLPQYGTVNTELIFSINLGIF